MEQSQKKGCSGTALRTPVYIPSLPRHASSSGLNTHISRQGRCSTIPVSHLRRNTLFYNEQPIQLKQNKLTPVKYTRCLTWFFCVYKLGIWPHLSICKRWTFFSVYRKRVIPRTVDHSYFSFLPRSPTNWIPVGITTPSMA